MVGVDLNNQEILSLNMGSGIKFGPIEVLYFYQMKPNLFLLKILYLKLSFLRLLLSSLSHSEPNYVNNCFKYSSTLILNLGIDSFLTTLQTFVK